MIFSAIYYLGSHLHIVHNIVVVVEKMGRAIIDYI
jgi:hypothetical protein